VDLETARTIHKIFSEIIIAPEFTPEALELLKRKKDRRLVRYTAGMAFPVRQYRSFWGGVLVQERDAVDQLPDLTRVVTTRTPTEEQRRALDFAWKVVKHVKSNAVVFAAPDRTLAVGAGQMSRVDSTRIAVAKAKQEGLSLEGSVLASDAFFPFPDAIEEAARVGVTAIIQPGGSIRDKEIIQAAEEAGLAMLFTGLRHFRH
jgi:phosphoribosylaminoimidazolecarboxamide formyltransferase/IMP cyclohydrolase